MIDAVPREDRRAEYWSWAAGALYVLITLDVVTTLYAARLYGPAPERNPLMRWALEQGPLALVVLNLAALLVLAVLFQRMIDLTLTAPPRYRPVIALAFEVWLALVLAAGLAVFANNLTVIVHGENLRLAAPLLVG